MTDTIEIQPAGRLRATIRPPGSKSITNRALVCAALAEGRSLLTGALDSDDTRVMIEGLGRMGIAVRHDPAERTISVSGCDGRPPAPAAEMKGAKEAAATLEIKRRDSMSSGWLTHS